MRALLSPHVITMPDIKSTVKKLHAEKSSGVSAARSDCFIHGIDFIKCFISMLFTFRNRVISNF